MIYIGLRLDDPSTTSLHGLEREILSILAAIRIPATFAVIPFRRGQEITPDAVPHLLDAHEAGHIEIALHGNSHESHSPTPSDIPSEFANRSREQQEADIATGHRQLEEVFGTGQIKGFVPPWNTFDETTEAVLDHLGFTYLSAGPRLPRGARPKAVPRTCHINELDSAIHEARSSTWGDAYIVALMHHYDFRESGEAETSIDIPWFQACLQRHGRAPDVRFVRLHELAGLLPAALLGVQRHRHRIPWPIQRRLPSLCLAWPHPRVFLSKATSPLAG